jgi:hypothetical protein
MDGHVVRSLKSVVVVSAVESVGESGENDQSSALPRFERHDLPRTSAFRDTGGANEHVQSAGILNCETVRTSPTP